MPFGIAAAPVVNGRLNGTAGGPLQVITGGQMKVHALWWMWPTERPPRVLGSEAERHLLSMSDVRVTGGPLVRLSLRPRASFIRNDSPDVTTTIAW